MATLAEELTRADREVAVPLASTLLKPLNDNFVQRPWGGGQLRAFKGLDPDPGQHSPLGEAFEIAAFDADDEARAYPSMLPLEDGSAISLPALLQRHAETLLGKPFTARYGNAFPLLPKILDVKELLSVQGHPEGHTEVYVIIEADPGASIRLGFNRDIDGAWLEQELLAGRREQRELIERLDGVEPQALQRLCAPWFADRDCGAGELEDALRPLIANPHWNETRPVLERLKQLYWRVLDLMNEIPVAAGQVIHNANPARLTPAGRQPSAEVHALGNPEGREILALEIRKPGPTFRAWDNVRFPVREVDVRAAIDALNLKATQASDFLVEPLALPERPGILRSVDSPFFRLEHLRPLPGRAAVVDAEPPHSLHALSGAVTVRDAAGGLLGTLARGESALVPVGVGGYRLETAAAGADVVKVSLPLDAPS